MANTRFVASIGNYALYSSILNGTGGGAPALSEATGYPMSNALQHDRYTQWQVAGGAGTPVNYDFDLGLNRDLYAIGLHGFRLLSGTMGDLTIQYAAAVAGYVPGAWSTFGTIAAASLNASGVRDVVSVDTTPPSGRYIRLSFVHTTAVWSVGKVFATGTPTINAGVVYDIGGVETELRYQLVTTGPTGHPLLEDIGDQGRAWTVGFSAVSTATKNLLIGLGQQSRPFSLVDENDALYEVRTQSGVVMATRVFNDLWNVSLELVRLP